MEKPTFTSSVGDITRIVITSDQILSCDEYFLSDDWSYVSDNNGGGTLTWQGAQPSSTIDLFYTTEEIPLDLYLSSIEFTISSGEDPEDPTPSTLNPVTWNSEDMNDLDLQEYTNTWSEYQQKYISYNGGEKVAERKDVVATISGSADGAYAQFSTYNNNTTISLSDGGTLTFSSATRQFESIVINYTGEYGYVNDNSTGWNDDTQNVISWSGSATNSVVLESAYVPNIASIVFTFADESGEEPGDEPGDENKTATSVVIYGGENYYDGQFTIVDTDLGSFGVSYTLPNVYLQESESSNPISEKSLTITSSDESVVAVSLSNFIDEEHIYRTIQFVQNDYGHAVITVSFAGDETYASSHASFDYYYIMNTNPMAACHVEDLDHTTRTNLVMTEGDRIGSGCSSR